MCTLRRIFDLEEMEPLLDTAGLCLSEKPEYSVGLYESGRLTAVGSLQNAVIMGLAVKESKRGEGLLNLVMSHLIEQAALRGHNHLFLYTKPENTAHIESLGFCYVGGGGPSASLFEFGLPDFQMYIDRLKEKCGEPKGTRGAVIMNANPPTNGHLSLLERASAQCDELLVFVVETDRSEFSFEERFRALRDAARGNQRVRVFPSGPYMISSATFPAYFLKAETHAQAQALLDVDIFKNRIAPALGIRVRFVGREPFCELTNRYNAVMLEELPKSGIDVVCFERKTYRGTAISATEVRRLNREGRLPEIRPLVPDSTWELLKRRNELETKRDGVNGECCDGRNAGIQ